MDKRVNKWKVLGYVILSWIIINTVAKVALALDTVSSVDLVTVNAMFWAFTFLIIGIHTAYKSKKKIDLAYGIGGFFLIPIFVGIFGGFGLLLVIASFGYTFYEWEKMKLEIK